MRENSCHKKKQAFSSKFLVLEKKWLSRVRGGEKGFYTNLEEFSQNFTEDSSLSDSQDNCCLILVLFLLLIFTPTHELLLPHTKKRRPQPRDCPRIYMLCTFHLALYCCCWIVVSSVIHLLTYNPRLLVLHQEIYWIRCEGHFAWSWFQASFQNTSVIINIVNNSNNINII